jgi:hypothetical protein
MDNFGSYPSGGNVVFVIAPAGGATITITRSTPKTTITSFVDGQPLTADAINHAVDRLTLLDQEIGGLVTTAPTTPVFTVGVAGGPITLVAGNQTTFVNAQAIAPNPCVVNLPLSTGTQNVYYIKKTDATAYSIAITPNGTDTIDGANAADSITIRYASNSYIDYTTGTWLKF